MHRNGFFFLLDRATGKNILTGDYIKTNWTKGLDKNGTPIPNPARRPPESEHAFARTAIRAA